MLTLIKTSMTELWADITQVEQIKFFKGDDDIEARIKMASGDFFECSATEGRELLALINNAAAPVAAPAPKTTDVAIISMTRDQTKNSGSPMWRCGTDRGFMVNVFRHDDPLKDAFNLFNVADYGEPMSVMMYGETINWTKHPIKVSLVQNGSFWNVVSVVQRPEDAEPDPPPEDDDG